MHITACRIRLAKKNLKKALNKKVSWFFWPSLGGRGVVPPPPIGDPWSCLIMIKAQKPRNFQKKFLKFSEKSPKNPKNLPSSLARRMGDPVKPDRGICLLFRWKEVFGWPPIGHAWLYYFSNLIKDIWCLFKILLKSMRFPWINIIQGCYAKFYCLINWINLRKEEVLLGFSSPDQTRQHLSTRVHPLSKLIGSSSIVLGFHILQQGWTLQRATSQVKGEGDELKIKIINDVSFERDNRHTAANWLSLTNGTWAWTQFWCVTRSCLKRASPCATVMGGWMVLQSLTWQAWP